MCREKTLKQSRPGFLAFLLCTVTQNSVWHLEFHITNFVKPRFGAFEVVLERRNKLAEVHFCLNVSNDIHRYLSALVSNLVSGVNFQSQHAGLVRVATPLLGASNGKL